MLVAIRPSAIRGSRSEVADEDEDFCVVPGVAGAMLGPRPRDPALVPRAPGRRTRDRNRGREGKGCTLVDDYLIAGTDDNVLGGRCAGFPEEHPVDAGIQPLF